MAVFSKNEILKYMNDGSLAFSPELDELQLQPHSVDLRLGYTFMVPRTWKITSAGRETIKINTSASDDPKATHPVELEEGQFFEVLPKEFVIATTLENIKMPHNVMATLYPRSSLNRRGLSINLTGVVDAGYEGSLIIPMENKNQQPVRIYPGERFCQLTFHEIKGRMRVKKSRWHKADTIVGILPESDENESELIVSGKVRDLKRDYELPDRKDGSTK